MKKNNLNFKALNGFLETKVMRNNENSKNSNKFLNYSPEKSKNSDFYDSEVNYEKISYFEDNYCNETEEPRNSIPKKIEFQRNSHRKIFLPLKQEIQKKNSKKEEKFSEDKNSSKESSVKSISTVKCISKEEKAFLKKKNKNSTESNGFSYYSGSTSITSNKNSTDLEINDNKGINFFINSLSNALNRSKKSIFDEDKNKKKKNY